MLYCFGTFFGVQSAPGPTYRKVVRLLLVAGADPTLACYEGPTPRQLAEQSQTAEVVAELDVSIHAPIPPAQPHRMVTRIEAS
jgi:hypothetical protein